MTKVRCRGSNQDSTHFTMRVLWLSPGFPANEQDQNCLPTLQLLAQEMISQGLDLQVITLGYPFHKVPYQWHGIPVISGYGFNKQWFRWYNWLRVVRYALEAHKTQKFDVIHSFWLGPSWLIGRFLQSRWKIPHYTTLMGQDVLSANKYRHFLQNGKNLVAVSRFQQDVFEISNQITAAHSIPWGINQAEIPDKLPEKRPVDLLGCGAFIPLKNWSLWLQVVAEVAKQRPGLRAELIGNGVDKPALEKQIRLLGLEQQLSLSGHLPRHQVLERMQNSKILLHTSNFESYGFVLAEAVMCGCRVISTPVGIAPEFPGMAFPAEKLAEQVLLALDRPMPQEATLPYTMQDTAKAYVRLYQSPKT